MVGKPETNASFIALHLNRLCNSKFLETQDCVELNLISRHEHWLMPRLRRADEMLRKRRKDVGAYWGQYKDDQEGRDGQ